MPAWWEQPRSVAPSLSSALNVAQPPAATSEENPFLRSAMDAYRAARDRAAQNMAPPPQAAPAQQAPQPKPVFDVGNTLSAAGTFLKQVPTSLGGALAQLYVGGDRPDTYHPWARSLIDAMNRQSADNQALIDQRKAANQSDSTSESLLEASGSSGFTGASALAGLGGFAAGSAAAGPLAGGAAAMGASGAAGYRMAEAGFLDEIFSKAEAAMQAKAGRGMTEAEKADLHQKVLPIAQNTGLWEAGPEAVGNALLALGGGTALGLLGKEAVKSLASSAAKRAGVRLASGLAGVGSEVTTEGVTQFHQGNDQARADAVLAGQSPEDAKPVYEGAQGLWQATKDVAPQTLALVGMMGLGAKAAHIAARPIQQRMEGKAAGQTAIEQADLARAALHDMDESQVDTVIQQTQKALTDYPKMPKATREQLTAGLESLVADQQARTNGDAFRAAMADPEAMQTRRGQSAVLGMADPARVQQLSDGEVEAATQLADEMGRLPDMTDEQKAGFAEAAQRYRQALQARRTMAGLDEAIKTDASVIEPVIQSIQRAAFGNQKAGITPEYARAALDDGELSRHLTAIESLLDRHGDKIGERTESLEKARDVLLAEREHRATQPDWQQQNAAVRAANDPAEVRFRSAFAQAPEKAIAKLTSEHAPLINSLMQSLQTRIGNIEKTGYSAPETLTKPLALLQARKAALESAAQPSPTPAQPPVTQPITQPAQQQPTAPITSLADALQVTPTGNDPLAELIAQQQTQPRPAPVVRPRPVVPGREAKDGAAELSRLLGPQPQQQQVPAAPQQGVQSLADLLQRPSTQGAVASSPAVAQGSIAPPVALAPRPKLTQEEIKARQRKSSSAQFLPQQQKIAQHPAEAALISQPQPTGAPHEKGQAETEAVLNEASPPANTEAGKALQAPDSETPKDTPPSSAPVQTPAGVGKATRVGRGVTAIELPVGAAVRESEKPDVPTEESSQQLTKLLGAFVRREIDLKTRYNKDDKTTQVITPDGHTVGAYPGILTDYEPVLSDLGRRLQQALQRERRTIPNHPSQQSLDEFSIAYELGRTIPEFEIAAEDIGSVVKTGGDGAFQVDLRALHEKIKKSGQKALTAEADFSPATPADRQDQARREALADPEFRAAMEGYRHTTGWAERGGHLILKNADEAVSRDNIAGRTQWLPNSPWWAASTGARKGFNEAQIKNLLERFQQGEAPKNAKESRFLDFLIEDIADEKARNAESAALEAELTPKEQERLDRAEQEARAWLGEDRYEALLESLAKRYPDASPAAFSRALLDTLETALVQRNDAQQRQADVQPGTASRTGRDGAGSTEKTTESAGAAADEESAAEEKGQPLLSGYSAADLKTRDEAVAKAKADQDAKDKAFDQKAAADEAAKDFRLTGSDRTADVAAAQGQGALFARASSVTPATLFENLKALADDATVQALLDNGRLRLVARQADLPSQIPVAAGERVAGAVYPKTGQVYLVAENIRPDELKGYLAHEVGVHQAQLNLNNQPKAKALRLAHAVVRLVGARRMLGETSFSDVLNQLERMRAAGHTGVKAAFAQAEAAMKALDQNPALLREEALAYLVQQRPNLPLVKRIVVAVRTFLYRAGFRVSLTENDVRALAVSALKGATRQGFDRFTRTPQQEVIDALRIIKEGDDLLFQSPTAQSKALSEILKEIYPDVSIERPMSKEEIGGIEDETGVPIVEGWAVKAPVKQSNGKMGHDYVYFMRGGDKGDRVWIDVSNLKEGSSGSRIYMVAADWAYNNGWVFQGDPAGLSDKAVYRRTETMLASAIKHGTTRHLEPHPKQKLHWTNDDDQNFKALVQKSADNLLAQVPQLKGVHYDFQRRQFEDGDGRPFTDHLFTELAQSRGARAAQAGSTTLKRASFIQSLSSKGGGSRTGGRERLLGAVVRELRQPVSTGGLKGIFYARAYTAEQLAAMAKIGKRPPKSWTERFAGLTDRIGLKLRQAVADQYASLLALDQKAYGGDVVENQTAASAWVKTRLSRSVDGPMNLLLHEAALKMDADGALDVISGSKGLKQILEPLGVEADDFLKWVAGWRADRLKKEDRERLFTDADIAALKALNQGTMPDGRSRAAVYGKALREFSALQKSVMDIAEQAGLIDAKERKAWERDFYVPFYRLAEDTQDARALNAGDGLVRQEAFKRLKGGKDRLNDLLENTVMNWNHLLSASLKNSAARQALINAQRVVYDGGKVAERVDPNKESTKGCVFYRENGKEQWFRVNDPLILEAITSLDFSGLKGPVMGLLRKARMLLTRTTTISPAFKVANLIRDTVQTLAVSKADVLAFDKVPRFRNVIPGLGNIVQGWKNYAADSDIRRSLLAGGGAFRFGTSLEGNAEALKKLLTKGVRPETILDTPKKLFDLLGSAYRHYEDLGDNLENVNRAALYTQLREQGKSHLYASFQARDLLDFSASGASGAVRFLTAVVPFLNARIQGLDKLGRAATEPAQRGRFAVTLLATTLASVVLYLWFKDDPDFKEREEWDRDAFWWAKFGGVVVRIPKPFEVGALATLLGDRVVEQMVDKEANSKLYLDRLKFTLTQTFSISGPQLLMPALNVWANKDPFTGRPIETTAQQRLSPGLRRNARTSDTAQAASALSGGTLSPVQMDYLIGAYFGWLGRQAVLLADFATRPLTDRAAPDRTPVVGDLVQRFMPTEKTGSKYLTRFYEAAATAERHYADIRELLRRDEKEAARILLQNHAAEIGRLKAYRAAGAELNDWNNQLKMLADLPASKISDEQRTAMRDRLQKAKLHLARAMMEGRAVD